MTTHEKNLIHINKLHPFVRKKFIGFEKDCRSAKYPLKIYSSFRSWELQSNLYKIYKEGKSNIPAARPGNSFHNYGFAIDTYVWSKTKNQYVREYNAYKKIVPIAKKYGIYWLGQAVKSEMHHFDVGGAGQGRKILLNKLKKNFQSGKVDDNGYVLLDNFEEGRTLKTFKQNWNIEIGAEAISNETTEETPPEPGSTNKLSNIEEIPAVGIWQIVKLVADQYSLSQSVNDAGIAFNQGSLYNFVQKVVQKPWLQFFGETVKDQYYFFVRKEPFDYNGWVGLPIIDDIEEQDVISDDLDWYNGDVFSWFQIIPRGSFLGKQNLIFAYVTAVFFEEYAEIWGSKPNIQVSNYINFGKTNGKKTLYEKAREDLRYMVESNMYLPFTRQGTIIINGHSNIKRGYKIRYLPTGEMFYIEAISHRYTVSDAGTEFTTVLQVSRGMKMEYVIAPTDRDTISYFNLISFDEQRPSSVEKTKETKSGGKLVFYFDNSRNYLINLDEDFSENDTISQKMQEQIRDFPTLRQELKEMNDLSLSAAADFIDKHKDAKQFTITGYIDEDGGSSYNNLSIQRAETVKNMVIDLYLKKYSHFSKLQLTNLLVTKGDVTGLNVANYDVNYQPIDYSDIEKSDNDRRLKVKAYERYVKMEVEPYEVEKEKETTEKKVNWKVNDKVFQFFINRKQFANGGE